MSGLPDPRLMGLTDLNSYLHQQRLDGATQDRAKSFTVAPHLARRKLAESVPKSFSAPWAGLGFLRAAFELSGLTAVDSFSGGVVHAIPLDIIKRSPVRMGLHFSIPDDWDATSFQESLQTSCEQPFSDSSPVGLCLSRASLILTKCDVDATFMYKGLEQPDYHLTQQSDTRVDKTHDKGLFKDVGRSLTVLFSSHAQWDWARPSGDHDGHQNQRRRLRTITEKSSPIAISRELKKRACAKEASLFGIPIQMHSIWTRSPSQETLQRLFDYEEIASWFNYRTSKAVLIETIVASEEQSPLVVSAECLGTDGSPGVQKPGENMSSWQRFRTKGEKLILRCWNGQPKQQPEEAVPVKAVFSVALSDAASKVAFSNWGETPEHISIPDCPPGMAAFVHWPELKQSLYGDAWVKDEAFKEAIRWTQQEAAKVFQVLSQEFDYLWDMLVRDHVKKSYRVEVRGRLMSWLDVS